MESDRYFPHFAGSNTEAETRAPFQPRSRDLRDGRGQTASLKVSAALLLQRRQSELVLRQSSSNSFAGESEPADVPTACSKNASVWQMNGSNSGSSASLLGLQDVDVARADAIEVRDSNFALIRPPLAEEDLARRNTLVKVVPSAVSPQRRILRSPGSRCSKPDVALETILRRIARALAVQPNHVPESYPGPAASCLVASGIVGLLGDDAHRACPRAHPSAARTRARRPRRPPSRLETGGLRLHLPLPTGRT